jgi:hypothetical protein
VYWVFVTNVLARKFHKNFSEFPLKRCGTFFLFFALRKSLSGTETVARHVSSCRKKCHLTFWNKTCLISKIWTTKKPAPQSSAATIIHKNVSRHRSPPPVTAASRRSMSNISFFLINQALVVSSSNGRDRSPA